MSAADVAAQPPVMPLDARIYVAGHAGLVGSAVVRRLEAAGHTNILTASRQQLDLRDQSEVSHWFKGNCRYTYW
jgi:GDP-L-fucose synthase